MVQLGVNLDHVATLRQARRGLEPDPVWAAVEAQLGGADAITLHLREDRRHVQDHDLGRIAATSQVRLNLEMAATEAMLEIALRTRPHMATLVPEGRAEITTEGGLNVVGDMGLLKQVVARLREGGITVSAFIDAEIEQVDAAAEAGFDMCELHTGPYAHAFHEAGGDLPRGTMKKQLERLAAAGRRITQLGMLFNAGHALNYVNIGPVLALANLRELHIGHSIVSRALFVGLRQAVAEMKRLLAQAPPAPWAASARA